LIYLPHGLLLTMAVNVALHEALTVLSGPTIHHEAAAIWATYPPRWQILSICAHWPRARRSCGPKAGMTLLAAK